MYADRIKYLPPYLFAAIDKAKQDALAKGVDVIDLSVGDPDLPTPSHIVEAMREFARPEQRHDFLRRHRTRGIARAPDYRRRGGIEIHPHHAVSGHGDRVC